MQQLLKQPELLKEFRVPMQQLINGFIEQMKQKYPDIFVFLTGGHSFYFESRLKNSIFADINLVMTGLNRILEYNVEN